MSRKNLIVGQSGGPTAVINSSLTELYPRECVIRKLLSMFTE